MRETIATVLIVSVAALLLTWQLRWSREARAASAYERATLGQGEAEIIAAVGTPDEILQCGEFLWWKGDQVNPPKNDGRCVKWVRYNFFLGAFAFGYSADGKLVSRYHYQSE